MKKKGLVSIIGVLALAMALCFALVGCGGGSSSSSSASSSSAAPANGGSLRFVTGGESGTYYAFGGVIAQHATNNTDVSVTTASSGGSQANIQELEDGTAELGFVQSDVMAYAYEGVNLFDSPVTTFSVLASLYQEQVQIVTCDESITSVADLAGKNVSIGAAGSGVYFNAIDILGAYGLTEDDINPTYQSFQDSADALKDGKIDAAFIVAGAPTTAITDLSATKTAYLISLDQEHVQKLIAENNFYSEAVIPAGTYNGQDADVVTVGVDAIIIVDNAVSDEDVYALTADIFDNAADLVDNHAKYAELSIEKAASVTSVPYHPGAAKYFAEKGIDVPTK